MLFVAFLLLGLTAAVRVCYEATENLFIPSCTYTCLRSETSILDGVCADNLKGICELNGGVASFFRVYTKCLSQNCPATTARERFVEVFQEQCGWSSNISDTQARYFGEWAIYLYDTKSTTSEATCAITQRMTTFATVPSPSSSDAATITSADSPVTISSTVLEASTSTQLISDAATALESSVLTVLGDDIPSTFRTTTFITVYNTASPARVNQDHSELAMSTAAIAGTAVGGTLLFALACGAVLFLLRRRKLKQPTSPRSMSPPIFEPGFDKLAREKAGLKNQGLEEPYSEVGVGAPVGRAELDGGSPVSPMYTSVGGRNAIFAQNF